MKIGSYPDDDEYMGHVGHEAFFSRGLCNHPSHDPTQAARETPACPDCEVTHPWRDHSVGSICGRAFCDRTDCNHDDRPVAARETRPDPLTPEEVHAAHHAFGVAHDCTTLDPVCGWDTRRGDGPIGGPCRLPPLHDGQHDPALRAATPNPAERHPESCERCGRGNITWHAPSPLWNAVMRDPTTGDDRHSIVCPFCFVEIAEAKGFLFSWHLGPHEDVSGLWTDTDGRAWDATKCLWATTPDRAASTVEPECAYQCPFTEQAHKTYDIDIDHDFEPRVTNPDPAEPRGQAVFGCTALDCALTEGHTGPHAPDRVASTVEPTYLDEVSYQSGFEDGRAVTNAEPGLDVGALREAITLAAWGYDFGSPIDAGRVGRDLAGRVAKHYAAHLALTPDYNTIDPKDGGRNDR